MKAVVAGIGIGLPDKVVTNADLEKLVETSDEWILQRTGIRERRMVADDENASDLAARAAAEALKRADTGPEEIDMIICGTVTGDHVFPSTACIVQHKLGAKNAGAFDVGAACAGFIYSLEMGSLLVESGRFRKVLVIGVDVLTRHTDWTDRGTCVLFGDGAGALLLEGRENTERGVMKTFLHADGEGGRHIILPTGGTKYPAHAMAEHGQSPYIFMAGKEVYRFAVHAMGDACCRLMEKAGVTAEDIDLFVPHQANLRIIDSAAEKIGLPPEKVFKNVDRYGNTSAASIPIGLYEAQEQGLLKPGMVVMTVGFGAGLVWGANLIRW